MRIECLAAAVLSLACLGPIAPEPAGLFSSYSPVDFSLKAPLNDLFAGAQKNPEYSVAGTVSYTDESSGKAITIEDVEITVRGRTSKRESECSFPKLKVRFNGSDSVADSMFRGMKALKIGTHCGDDPGGTLTEKYGRWANEKASWREAFVYRLLEALDVRSFRARPARITYVSEDAAPLVRGAMLLEDDRDAMKRFGASREIEPPEFRDAERDFSAQDTAKLAFAEALIGNFDWCLKFTANDSYRCDARRPLWNILAFAPHDGRAFPVLYDFDIAGIVVGRHKWFADILYDGFDGKSPPAIEVLGQVQHTRSLFPRSMLDATRRSFVARKADAFAALRDAAIDADGRRIAEAYLTGFFSAIEDDDAFYLPVIVRGDERLYLDPDRTKPACERDIAAPPGTVVGRTVETSGPLIKAPLLDVQWRWAPPARCDAVHRQAVWLDKAAVSTDYPAR